MSKVWRIGSRTLDGDSLEIREGDATTPIQPRLFKLLAYLIAHRSRAVTKQELHDNVWGDTVVSDSALSTRIKEARRLLGDDGKSQRAIRTVPRVGFQFVGEVEEPAGASGVGNVELVEPTDRSLLPMQSPRNFDDTGKPSIVVLPLQVSGDEGDPHLFANGVVNDVITRLARARSLYVISRGTALRLRDPAADLSEVGASLGVRYVAHGSLHFSGNRFRLHMAVTEVDNGREIWAEAYDRAMGDIFAVQDELALAIVREIEDQVTRAEISRSLARPTGSLDAWSAYHRGLWHLFRNTREDLETAHGFLRTSLELEPHSARAHAARSFAFWLQAFHEYESSPASLTDKAFEHAQRSLEIDAEDPFGHFALGRAWQSRQNNELAMREYATSIKLNPSMARAYYARGLLHFLNDDLDDADEALDFSLRLSPYDPMAYAVVSTKALGAAIRGDYEQAAELAEHAAELPNGRNHRQVQFIATYCNGMAGHDEQARRRLKQLERVSPGFEVDDYLRVLPLENEKAVREMRKVLAVLRGGSS